MYANERFLTDGQVRDQDADSRATPMTRPRSLGQRFGIKTGNTKELAPISGPSGISEGSSHLSLATVESLHPRREVLRVW